MKGYGALASMQTRVSVSQSELIGFMSMSKASCTSPFSIGRPFLAVVISEGVKVSAYPHTIKHAVDQVYAELRYLFALE